MKLYESETIELQEIDIPDLKKEIIAFANTKGGTIYFGVQDSDEIIRVVLPNIHAQELSVENEKHIPILGLFEHQKEITRSDVQVQ